MTPLQSTPFQVYRWSDHPELHRCTGALAKLIDRKANRKRKRKKDARAPFISAIRLLVLNAYAAHRASEDMTFGVNLGAHSFDKGTAYNAMRLTHGTFVDAHKGLIGLGLLEIVKEGFYDPRTKIGRNTKVKGTPKLIALLEGRLEPSDAGWQTIAPPVLVQIGKGDDQGLSPKPGRELDQITSDLTLINKVLSRNWFDIELSNDDFKALNARLAAEPREDTPRRINFSQRTVYRKFNDRDLKTGGRFYGAWWQGVPSDQRKFITIHEKKSVEVDYSAIHPSILYATLGIELIDDPYNIGFPVPREMVKDAMMVLINAKSRVSHITKAKISTHNYSFADITQKLREKHAPISHFFNSGAWGWLQKKDSDLANSVMLHFAHQNIPILPVHDSFIMHHGHEDDLIKVMSNKFEERFGVGVKLKVKPSVFDSLGSGNGPIVAEKITMADLIYDRGPNSEYNRRLDEGKSACGKLTI